VPCPHRFYPITGVSADDTPYITTLPGPWVRLEDDEAGLSFRTVKRRPPSVSARSSIWRHGTMFRSHVISRHRTKRRSSGLLFSQQAATGHYVGA